MGERYDAPNQEVVRAAVTEPETVTPTAPPPPTEPEPETVPE